MIAKHKRFWVGLSWVSLFVAAAFVRFGDLALLVLMIALLISLRIWRMKPDGS